MMETMTGKATVAFLTKSDDAAGYTVLQHSTKQKTCAGRMSNDLRDACSSERKTRRDLRWLDLQMGDCSKTTSRMKAQPGESGTSITAAQEHAARAADLALSGADRWAEIANPRQVTHVTRFGLFDGAPRIKGRTRAPASKPAAASWSLGWRGAPVVVARKKMGRGWV